MLNFMRRRSFWKVILGTLGLGGFVLLVAAWPGCTTLTISPETTYVTEPLDKHGHVDYATALNQRLSQGITPETNANVLIWQALGPHPEGATMPAEYFQMLGIDPPSERGDYLVQFGVFLDARTKGDPRSQPSDWFERLGRASRWPWAAADDPELAEWLKINEKPLATIVEATRRPRYYNPLVPNRTDDWSPGLIESRLPAVQYLRAMANTLGSRAMLRLKQGNTDAAWDDLLAIHRLARLVAQGGTIIEALVGITIEVLTQRADLVFLDRGQQRPDQIMACLRDLQTLQPMPPIVEKVECAERYMLLDHMVLSAKFGPRFLEGLSRSNFRPPEDSHFRRNMFTRSIDWDPALRNCNQWYDRIGKAMRITDREERLREMAAMKEELTALRDSVSRLSPFEKFTMSPSRRGEMIGNILIALMLPAFDKVSIAEDRWQQNQRNLHLAFALVAHRRAQGRYPARLEDLVPKYIDAVPSDLFAAAPLKYQVSDNGFRLWSVGPNGVDDDGLGMTDSPAADDLAIQLPVTPPQK